MPETLPQLLSLASALRAARRARRMPITELARDAGVSPRLISEFEQGKRPNVSLETALRLLGIVGISIQVGEAAEAASQTDDDRARQLRAARRRQSWSGTLATLTTQGDPVAAKSAASRLDAVAKASALAVGLQRAPRAAR